MSKNYRVITIFISCPNDVENEKNIIKERLKNISVVYSKRKNIILKSLDWSEDVIGYISGYSPQSIINKQMSEFNYDIYIGILWNRFGDKQENGLTPTEEEFEDALEKYKMYKTPRIYFYFKTTKYQPKNQYEIKQISDVGKFRAFRTPIPGDSGHVFRFNSDSDSGLISDSFAL